jgi:hypothetical protein
MPSKPKSRLRALAVGLFEAAIGVAPATAFAVILGIPGAVAADQNSLATSQPSTTTADTPSVAFKTPDLGDLAWLQGQWTGIWGPRVTTVVWSAPHAGVILGTLQVVENDKTLVVEFLTIAQTPTGLEYRLLHFTPELAPWEKSGPAVLALLSMDSKKFVFQNQSDGEPQQIVFTRSDPDTFIDRSEILPETGDVQATEITFHRQKPSGGSASHR